MSGEQFSLIWNSFPRNLSSGLYTLLTDEQLVDVTLAVEGKILRAHKLILSVCSSYFSDLFKENSCKHPIVILKDMNYRDLSAMLQFMYQGEVNILQEDIASFLKVAETLQIKGLTAEKDTGKRTEHTYDKENDNSNDNSNESCNMKQQNVNYNSSEKNICEYQHSSNRETEWLSENQLQEQEIPLDSDIHDTNFEMKSTTIEDSDSDIQELLVSNVHGNLSYSKTHENTTESSNYNTTVEHRKGSTSHFSEIDTQTQCEPYMLNEEPSNLERNFERSDFIPNEQLESTGQPFGSEKVVEHYNNFVYNRTNYNEGQQNETNSGHNSSLSLETTLHMISQLSPTLCMERGKVIRMYSCPWCLRHFTRKENLKLHVRYIHGPLENLTCKLCGNKYKNSNSLRVHSYLYHNGKRDKRNKSLPGEIHKRKQN